jgi:S1-C subfamily serine protease
MVFVDAEYRFKDGKCIIYEISAVGPAERAGLQTGDVILAVNSIPIKEPAQLDFVVHLKSIPNPLKTGEPAIFKISRNDQEFSFTLIPSSMLSPRLPIRWIFRHL